MAYNPIGWQNSPSTNTPLDAANLSAMDAGIENAYGLFGTFATMPVASAVNSGIIYFATDTHQTFQSNGSAWVLLPAGSIAGAPVASTAPTTGQVLTYNGTDWVPQASTVPVNSWINMTLTSGNLPVTALPTWTNNIYTFLPTTGTGTAFPAPGLTTFTLVTTATSANNYSYGAEYTYANNPNTSYIQPLSFPYSAQSADNNFTWAPATGLLTVATAGMYKFEFNGYTWSTSYGYGISLFANGSTQLLASNVPTGDGPLYCSNNLCISLTANQAVNITSMSSNTGTANMSVFYLGSPTNFMAVGGGGYYLPTNSFTVTKL